MTISRRTRTLLLTSFGSVVLLLVLAELVSYQRQRDVELSVGLIEDNALASIRLMSEMQNDLQRERILVDRHVFEHDASAMAGLENRVASTRAELARSRDAYRPLVKFEGESAQWQQLQADLAVADGQLAAVLSLSRSNRDEEAVQILVATEPTFDAISRDFTEAIAINEAGADRAQHTIARLLGRLFLLRLAIGAAIVLVTAFVGVLTTRTVSRTEQQLADQATELEAKNRELDAFAGRVSHDLRGPLNTISLAASMLAERVPGEAATTSLMRRGITQMTNLVHDLLELSRLGALNGSTQGCPQRVASALEEELAMLVANSGGTLHLDLEPGMVTCSDGLLRQVLWNLAENAVKYRRMEVAPAVEIVGRATAQRYVLRVRDNGIGMSTEEIGHAFEPFFRGTSSKRVPGTGLGLSIVRRVIETSHGTIRVESEPGRGTTFVVELPVAGADLTGDPIAENPRRSRAS